MGNTIIQLRNDTAANWESNDPILALGELGLELDTNKFKFGDGSSNWSELAYANAKPTFKYGLYTLSANQTSNFAIGNHIEFDTCQGSLGGLSTGSGQADGIVTLEGGKTYKIETVVGIHCSSAGAGNTQIYDRTNSVYCGTPQGHVTFDNNASDSSSGSTMAIISPSTDIDIDLRIVTSSGNWTTVYEGSWMLIEEYGGY